MNRVKIIFGKKEWKRSENKHRKEEKEKERGRKRECEHTSCECEQTPPRIVDEATNYEAHTEHQLAGDS